MSKAPYDPILRLHLVTLWMKDERKLIVALILSVIIAIAGARAVRETPSAAWDRTELRDLSGLPLAPEGAEPTDPAPTQAESQRFLELQQQAADEQRLNLLDGR